MFMFDLRMIDKHVIISGFVYQFRSGLEGTNVTTLMMT
jgi:hypothetical protein